MKKLISVLAIAIICTTGSYKAFSQGSFTGTAKFTVKYEGDINPQKHIPEEKKFLIFENKVKEMDDEGVHTEIYDGDAGTWGTIINIPAYGCMAYQRTPEEVDEEMLSKVFSYEEREDTKTICGYVCKGYNFTIVTTTEDEDSGEDVKTEVKGVVYTTKEIGKNEKINSFTFPNLSGYPLYFEKVEEGVTEITQAVEVKKGKAKPIDFLMPSSCKICKTPQAWQLEWFKYQKYRKRKTKEWKEENEN